MLTTEQIRRIAQQSGARDIEKIETDIILTYLLQLFHEKTITGMSPSKLQRRRAASG